MKKFLFSLLMVLLIAGTSNVYAYEYEGIRKDVYLDSYENKWNYERISRSDIERIVQENDFILINTKEYPKLYEIAHNYCRADFVDYVYNEDCPNFYVYGNLEKVLKEIAYVEQLAQTNQSDVNYNIPMSIEYTVGGLFDSMLIIDTNVAFKEEAVLETNAPIKGSVTIIGYPDRDLMVYAEKYLNVEFYVRFYNDEYSEVAILHQKSDYSTTINLNKGVYNVEVYDTAGMDKNYTTSVATVEVTEMGSETVEVYLGEPVLKEDLEQISLARESISVAELLKDIDEDETTSDIYIDDIKNPSSMKIEDIIASIDSKLKTEKEEEKSNSFWIIIIIIAIIVVILLVLAIIFRKKIIKIFKKK